jgi:HEPN domain-containing protein
VELEDTCAKLDPYYIPTRYPDLFPGAGPGGLPMREEGEEAVSLLKTSLHWIENKLKQR